MRLIQRNAVRNAAISSASTRFARASSTIGLGAFSPCVWNVGFELVVVCVWTDVARYYLRLCVGDGDVRPARDTERVS